jgi:hypothetical protein
MGLLAVRGMVHGIAGVAQGQFQLARQVNIVLDKQDSHSAFSHNPAGAGVHDDVGDAATGIFPANDDGVTAIAGPQKTARAARGSALDRLPDADPGLLILLLTIRTVAARATILRGRLRQGRGSDQDCEQQGGRMDHEKRSRTLALNDG